MTGETFIVTVNYSGHIIQFLCLVKTDDVIHIIIDLFRGYFAFLDS